jgi:hypothetical protein
VPPLAPIALQKSPLLFVEDNLDLIALTKVQAVMLGVVQCDDDAEKTRIQQQQQQ